MEATRLLLCFALALTFAALLQAVEQPATEVSLDELKTQLLPAEFAKANVTLEDAKRMLRLKCKRAGVETAHVYEELEEAAVQLMRCVNGIANLTELYSEVEAAKPHGDLDVVFGKYCSRRPHGEQCLLEFNAKLQPCLTPEERLQSTVLLRVIRSLLDFACHHNGASVALFIAEEGPECIEANKENIALCMNASFGAYMPKEGEQLPELPELVIRPQQCIDLHEFEKCVLGYLEKCSISTPSNIVEALFKYVKNETKCQQEIDKVVGVPKKKARSSANSNKLSLVSTLLSTALMGVAASIYI